MQDEQSRRSLVDIVIYLASLVSDPRAIDPHLDTVRIITAQAGSSGSLSAEQQQELKGVKQKIEQYLLTQDPVRVFTAESLQLQLDNYTSGGNAKRAMWQLGRSALAAIIGTALVVLLLEFFGPGVKAQIVGTAFFALLHISAAYLFVSVLKAFTTKFRIAFRWICAGIVILGLSLVAQPIIELIGLRGTAIGSLLGFVPPLIAGVIMLIGASLYAKLSGLAVKKAILILLLAVAMLGTISILLPHAPSKLPDGLYSLVISIQASSVAISIASTVLLHKTSGRLSELYSMPTHTLGFAMGTAAAVSLYTYIFRIVWGGLTAGPATFVIVCFVSLMGLAFLYSGYVFNKASRY